MFALFYIEIMEVWKPLYECWNGINYEWLYEVSNTWKVRSLDRKIKKKKWWSFIKKWKILKLSLWNWQWRYFKIWLCINWNKKQYLIHRLVKYVFHWYSKLEVDHIDNDMSNNHIDNLEYVTSKENMNRAWNNNRITKEMCWWGMRWKFWKHHNRSKAIYQYTLDWEFIAKYGSTLEAERITWFSHTNIWFCARWKQKQSNGFIWKYNKNERNNSPWLSESYSRKMIKNSKKT